MPFYGQVIEWTEFNGKKCHVDVGYCQTPEEALEEAIKSARARGWTRPKWWQWWRRHDTRPPQGKRGEQG